MMAGYYKTTSQALCWRLSSRPLTFYVECSRTVRHFQAWSQLFLMSYSDGSGVYAGQLPSSSYTRPVSPIPAVLLTNVSVTLASHCFHQSAVLWHGTVGLWWLRAEKSNTYLLRRERLETYCCNDDSARFPGGTRGGNRMVLLGPSQYCLRNTGNRKLPPFHFPIGWNRVQKNCVFSCMATS